jgi:hypothetical protein
MLGGNFSALDLTRDDAELDAEDEDPIDTEPVDLQQAPKPYTTVYH